MGIGLKGCIWSFLVECLWYWSHPSPSVWGVEHTAPLWDAPAPAPQTTDMGFLRLLLLMDL